MFTVPLGDHRAVLEHPLSPSAAVTAISCLTRVDADNTWRQTSLQSVEKSEYGLSFPCANAIAVVRATRSEDFPE